MTSPQTTPTPQRSRAPIAITLGIVGALVVLFFAFSGFYTDFLWYEQLGFTSVLTTQWIATAGMFLIGFIAMAVPVWAALQLAYRRRPVYAKLSSQLDRYQELVEPLRRLAMYGIPILLGLFAGFSTSSRWKMALLWWNRTPTGETDPQFGLDTSFYMFELPFYQGVVGFASAVLLISALLSIAVSYLYGAVRLAGRELRISKAARIQIAIIAGLFVAAQAVSIWLDQYATLTETGTRMTGASFTDANAVIPGRMIMAGIAIFVALLFFVAAAIGRWRFPVVGTALLIVSSLVIGVAFPALMQKFQVEPNEKALEAEYLQRNIDQTRAAFGVDEVEETSFNAVTDAEPGALREDAETTANIRILDPALVGRSVAQLQQFKAYYKFNAALDVDRYVLDGQTQDTVVALRELNQNGLGSKSWVNSAVVYTHGYGLVAAYGNQRSDDGQPVFLESGIPSSGKLGEYEPRIYFGERSPLYSVVGAPKGTKPVEYDYPSGEDAEGQKNYTYTGDGGPKVDNIFKKVLFALKFQAQEFLFSDALNENSQVLFDREPRTRVQKVAPYLTIDSDPYPSVVDGRVKWIVDGYTTSANHPYSRIINLRETLTDAEQSGPGFALDHINYMRNSVKATVDAYDGSVTLYAWDEKDPVLASWQKIFPSTVKPMSEMSGDLMSHVRYPTDLFKVQRSILGQYHVTSAGQFFSETDVWTTPRDPQAKKGDNRLQPPYYLTMQMPGQESPSYSLYSTFIPPGRGEDSRNVLTGYLAADADAGAEDGKRADGYGKLRLLKLTSGSSVPGPGQVQNTFNASEEVSKQINLLKQGQSQVLNGNLLTIPVGGGLLYVQPVYVQSSGDTSFPLLRKVLVAFGDKIAFRDTLDEALDDLFGGDSGATAGDGGTQTGEGETPPPVDPEEPGENTGGETPAPPSADLSSALQEAKKAIDDRQAAMSEGDWTAYGEADKRLAEALDRALSLSE